MRGVTGALLDIRLDGLEGPGVLGRSWTGFWVFFFVYFWFWLDFLFESRVYSGVLVAFGGF